MGIFSKKKKDLTLDLPPPPPPELSSASENEAPPIQGQTNGNENEQLMPPPPENNGSGLPMPPLPENNNIDQMPTSPMKNNIEESPLPSPSEGTNEAGNLPKFDDFQKEFSGMPSPEGPNTNSLDTVHPQMEELHKPDIHTPRLDLPEIEPQKEEPNISAGPIDTSGLAHYESEIPPPPEQTELPELPKQSELPQPPKMPIRPEVHEQPEEHEYVFPKEPEKLDLPDEMPPPLSDIEPDHKDEQKKQVLKKGSVYVDVNSYKDALSNVSYIKNKIKESESYLKKLNEIKNSKDKYFEQFRSKLEDLQRKSLYIDKSLFEGGKLNG